MLTYLSWQLFLGLFVIGAKSLPDWNIDAQTNDMAPSESVLDNEIINSPTLALATTDGVSEFAQPPNGGNGVSSDMLIAQGSSGCASSSERLPRKIRARDEKICPTDRLQLNGGEEKGRPAAPNGQQDGGGQNSGGSGDPKPQVMIPPKDAKLPYVFMPKGDRPKEDPELCPVAMYPVPVCGRPSDAYISTSPYPGQLTVDPCYRCMFFFSHLDLFFHDDSAQKVFFFPTWRWTLMLKICICRCAPCRLCIRGRRKNWLLLSERGSRVWICKLLSSQNPSL